MRKNRPGVDEAAKAALVQKHQLEAANTQLELMTQHVENLSENNAAQTEKLEWLESRMAQLLPKASGHRGIDNPHQQVAVRKSLELNDADRTKVEDTISGLNFTAPFIDFDGDWPSYVRKVEEYAGACGVDLAKDPFGSLLSKQQKAELVRSIEEDLEQASACDRWDYVIGASCGVLAGLVDSFFVGAPGQHSILGKMTDQGANRLVERFASICGWKGQEQGSGSTASAIEFLERKFPVNYDHRHSGDVGFKMSTNNHHLMSLAHSPSLVGLVFSVLDQFTDKASYVSDGRLLRVKADSKLQGGNLVSKLYAGFFNWIGHIMSDAAGASGTKGRGSGVPIPFFELLQFVQFGKFGDEKQSVSRLAVDMFEQGYDARFGAAMAVPVLLNEVFIRVLWMLKRRYYHGYDWTECWPATSHASLRRMLLVGHGCLVVVDSADAAIRGGGQVVLMLTRMNLMAWTRFAFLGLRETHFLLNKDARRIQLIEERLNRDIGELLAASESSFSRH